MESLRPEVIAKRAAYRRRIRRFPVDRLFFLDESGLNTSMSRSHAWVKRGKDFIERVPMNWGKNLTLFRAIRRTGWVTLNTAFDSTNANRFVEWLSTKLLPKLRPGDVLVMDNLKAPADPRVPRVCRRHGVKLVYLPPYSPDYNPIESGWALQKQLVRRHAPRSPIALRRVARRARFRVTRRHCRNWFTHAGYT